MQDLYEKSDDKKGTYAGVHFDTDTKRALHQYVKENKIPNATRADKLHTTLLYSRKYLPDYKPAGKLQPVIVGEPTKFDVWETNGEGGPKTKCLILQYDCPALEKRHKELMEEHEATYDYSKFKTHTTLSYDIEDLDVDALPDANTIGPLTIVEEYGEDLDLNRARNKGVQKGNK